MSRRIGIADLSTGALSQARARYAAAVQRSDATPAEYRARAEFHRPSDPGAIAAEVRRLAACGLRAADVAQAMRLDLAFVHDVLGGAG